MFRDDAFIARFFDRDPTPQVDPHLGQSGSWDLRWEVSPAGGR